MDHSSMSLSPSPSPSPSPSIPLSRNRPYVLLMAAQLVSNLGDWLHFLALLTLVGFKWNATPWQITAVSLCMALPMLLGGPIAGYMSDRFNRKHLMISSDIVRAVVVTGLIFVESLWQVYVILIFKGLMDVLFSPAKNGKMKEIIATEDMGRAVAFSSSIEQITKIVGPALGGVLVALVGLKYCFVIDAGSFLLSAVILLGVPRHRMVSNEQLEDQGPHLGQKKPSFWQELSAGVTHIVGMPLLLCGLVVLIAVLLVLQIADSQTVTLFRNIPGVSENLLGWCMGASGLGTLLAALLVGRVKWQPLIKMGVGAALMGFVFAVAAIVTLWSEAGEVFIFTTLFTSFFLAGFGAGFAFIPFQTLLQLRTPSTLTGRVFGTVNSLTSAAVIMGPVLGGALVTAYGPVPAFIVSGSLMVMMGLIVFLLRKWIQRKDQQANPATDSAR
ncbi:MAG TPA: MFS transporter [Paenibacillus sp.]